MAARKITAAAFADLVRDRLMDADQVKVALGYRNRQSVFDAAARGSIPEPIIKLQRAYAFWDRLEIEAPTRR
jgi:hypothetical protein